MKDYQKPVAERIAFETEAIAAEERGPNLGDKSSVGGEEVE